MDSNLIKNKFRYDTRYLQFDNFKRINTIFYQSDTCHNNIDLRLICELLNRLIIWAAAINWWIGDDVMVGLGLG